MTEQQKAPGLYRLLESSEPEKRSDQEYREFVKSHYDGKAGWFTLVSGFFTGHESLAGRLFGPQAFDVRGCKSILDAGCGNGRYLRFLLRHADADAHLAGFDFSQGMLVRARHRLATERVGLVAADLTKLPFADQSFDVAVCGWVLEHLREPRDGLRELQRVLRPGGKLLLMVTEKTLGGAICSHFYHCRTYRRADLRAIAAECGLSWQREHWFSPVHRLFRSGGIVVELHKT